jgi:hypothetical protein
MNAKMVLVNALLHEIKTFLYRELNLSLHAFVFFFKKNLLHEVVIFFYKFKEEHKDLLVEVMTTQG